MKNIEELQCLCACLIEKEKKKIPLETSDRVAKANLLILMQININLSCLMQAFKKLHLLTNNRKRFHSNRLKIAFLTHPNSLILQINLSLMKAFKKLLLNKKNLKIQKGKIEST